MATLRILLIYTVLAGGLPSILFSQSTNINISVTSENPDTIFNNGLKELQNNNIDQATALLEKLLSYNTKNPDYYIYLGYLYYRHGNYEKAKEVLNTALEFDDKLIASHILLGEIHYQLNDILKARNEFEKVITLNSKIKLAHIRLYELFKDNNPAKANDHYLKIFQLPATKLEKLLPNIDQIGDITLPFNKSVMVLKDIILDKKIKKSDTVLDEIFDETTVKTDKEKIIVSVKDKKINFKMDFNFLLNPLKNFDKDKFFVKLIELIFVSIFLFIYSFFQRKREKKYERIVLNQFRLTTPKKE
ncbi:MAG: tetratricopeptide repeat protein [Spirochaetes bacterium]|nr:tetratricopeptide repeat protein [Spirochaetota bacterium]